MSMNTAQGVCVVHLVEGLDSTESATAPEVLRLPRRLGTGGRVAFALVNVVAAVSAALGIVLLWREETPGWWFSALFSVLLGALALVLWLAFFGSIAAAREDRAAQEAWAAVREHAVPEPGRVVTRRVGLAEEGTPTSFELDVALASGDVQTAHWRLERASQRMLQTQVPAVGAPARVWRASADAPVVIEVADPSRYDDAKNG